MYLIKVTGFTSYCYYVVNAFIALYTFKTPAHTCTCASAKMLYVCIRYICIKYLNTNIFHTYNVL